MNFPKELVVTVAEEGSADEFLMVIPNELDDTADGQRVAVYRLHQQGTVSVERTFTEDSAAEERSGSRSNRSCP